MTLVTHCDDFCHVLNLHLNTIFTSLYMLEKNCAVIILCGGKSQRMNFPKPYLNIDGVTFIDKIIDTYFTQGIETICVVMNEEFCKDEWEYFLEKSKDKIMLIKNENPILGRFHSLKLGLKKVLDNDFCFIQNIDNPFVNNNLILNLWKNRNEDGFVSPLFNGNGGHPILISKKIIQQLDEMRDEDLNLKEVLKKFPKTVVEVDDETILMNINTPEQYQHFVQDNITA
jgi:molybdenum cofactor cytidylyltransferase